MHQINNKITKGYFSKEIHEVWSKSAKVGVWIYHIQALPVVRFWKWAHSPVNSVLYGCQSFSICFSLFFYIGGFQSPFDLPTCLEKETLTSPFPSSVEIGGNLRIVGLVILLTFLQKVGRYLDGRSPWESADRAKITKMTKVSGFPFNKKTPNHIHHFGSVAGSTCCSPNQPDQQWCCFHIWGTPKGTDPHHILVRWQHSERPRAW
jgi:hypothetical protein